MFSALWCPWRQLVRQLWPLILDHGAHFIGDVVDAFDFEHVPVQPFQVRRHHHPAADKAGLIGAFHFTSWGRLLSWITRAPARKVMAALGQRFTAAR